MAYNSKISSLAIFWAPKERKEIKGRPPPVLLFIFQPKQNQPTAKPMFARKLSIPHPTPTSDFRLILFYFSFHHVPLPPKLPPAFAITTKP